MKLLKCHIENFGKLSNFDYDFESGLNTIKEENGFGKTTFASFIKAMFYGLETKRNTKLLIDRKKYQPWQGGAFGGSIEFELNDKKYKIERFFEKKEADDIFKLYDLSTNLESNDYTQNIGEEIFKLNKEAYERSTFISGQNMETSMNDSINAKLGNILENENDINTSEQAIKVLDEAIKNYKKTGGRGEINEKILEKTKLEQKLEQCKIDEKALQERKEKNSELKQNLKEKLEEQESLKKLLNLKIKEEAKNAKLENYKILQNNVDESKTAYEQYKKTINNESDIKNKIEFNQEKIKKLTDKITGLANQIKKTRTLNIILFIISVILILVGIIFVIKNISIIPISILGIGIVCFVVFIVKSVLIKKYKLDYFNKQQEKANTENLIETLGSLYEKEWNTKKSELTRLQNDYETKLKAKEEFESANNICDLEENTQEDIQRLDKQNIEKRIEVLSNEINKISDEKNYNKNYIDVLESNLDTVFDTENELEEITNKINEMKENCSILEKTKKYLETAKEQFSSHYLGNMKECFIKNLEIINGNQIDVNLDVKLNVQINEKGSNKQINYFSTGYKDLIYICMRLSLIDSLFENEKPFIILDDPFVNLDESKIKNATNLLRNLSKEYQIIYFVCHESRK